MIKLRKKNEEIKGVVYLPVSKSIFNRQLIISALSGGAICDISEEFPDDCNTLISALKSNSKNINIGHAGTAMRFLTAYFSLSQEEITLEGSQRMHKRPISILVDSLNEMGAEIEHINGNDCPPLLIKSSSIDGGEVSISGSVSSQYISAILLISPYLPKGLILNITPPLVSKPYVDMTLALMHENGVMVDQRGLRIETTPNKYSVQDKEVELDWSAASFWYELVALNPQSEILLSGLYRSTLQGDAIMPDLYSKLGVQTIFEEGGVRIKHIGSKETSFEVDCTEFPDLALPVACTCAGLGLDTKLTGLSTLLIKETNRILALKTELNKLGISVETSEDALWFERQEIRKKECDFNTYDDHRMAMCLAPLTSIISSSTIHMPEVVSKSYPKYWDMMSIFFVVSKFED